MRTLRFASVAALIACGIAIALVTAPPPQAYPWFGQVVGTGDLIAQQRSVGPFHRVTAKGGEDLAISIGGAQSVAVEAQSNIAELIETTVRDGTLEVKSTKSYTTHRKVTVRVTVPALDAVAVNGSSDVTIAGASGGRLDLSTNGSGDFQASGNVDRLTYTCNGSGDARLARLIVRDAVVRIHGSGDARLHVSETLDVEIFGSGDVTYIGTPRILRQVIRGSGSVSAAGGE